MLFFFHLLFQVHLHEGYVAVLLLFLSLQSLSYRLTFSHVFHSLCHCVVLSFVNFRSLYSYPSLFVVDGVFKCLTQIHKIANKKNAEVKRASVSPIIRKRPRKTKTDCIYRWTSSYLRDRDSKNILACNEFAYKKIYNHCKF